jgi:hypothetical protein
MMTSLNRRLEKAYIASYIESIEVSLEILFDFTWISTLSLCKKIIIRRIIADIDPEEGYPSSLQIDDSTQQIARVISIASRLTLI